MPYLLILFVLFGVGCQAAADGMHPNVPFKTLGGRQFWRDVWWCEGWRVQTNVWTGHSRLLDERDVRRGWGEEAACLARGAELAPGSPERAELVVLLHGLGRSDASLDRLAKKLRERGHAVATVGYPSTRGSVEEHAAGVATLLERLDPPPARVSFVTHSLGGIVARSLVESGWPGPSRPGRMVQLAPPNTGSSFARAVLKVPGLELFAGESLSQLAEADLPGKTTIEVGVIAAGSGTKTGWNLLVPGDDDGVVSVDETRLEGSQDHVTVRSVHTLVMNHRDVVGLVDRFLVAGSFEE